MVWLELRVDWGKCFWCSTPIFFVLDLHGAWENVTVHPSPLFTAETKGQEKSISVVSAGFQRFIWGDLQIKHADTCLFSFKDGVVKQWLDTGISKDKLMLGLASFGRSFVLKNGNDKCPMTNSPILCAGPKEDHSGISGLFCMLLKGNNFFSLQFHPVYILQYLKAYTDACEGIKYERLRYKWLESEKAPFVYSTQPDDLSVAKWGGFEDIWSIDLKVKYLIDAELGGATLFSLDKEDYRGDCFEEPYPILRTINHHLNRKKNVSFPHLDYVFFKTEAALFNYPDKMNYITYLFSKLYSSGNKSNYFVHPIQADWKQILKGNLFTSRQRSGRFLRVQERTALNQVDRRVQRHNLPGCQLWHFWESHH